jgi:predicted transcriptional regulator
MLLTIPTGTETQISIPVKQNNDEIERIGYSVSETAKSLGISVPTVLSLIKNDIPNTVENSGQF